MEVEKINYPQFFDLVSRRYSCRGYDDSPVSREMLMAIVETGRLAQSACNRQPWKFLVIDTPELREQVTKCYEREWAREARAFIVALGNSSEAWVRPCDGHNGMDVDVAIACENMCLAAASLGLGACWIGNFDVETLRCTLDIPAEWSPVAIISIGYPKPSQVVPEKKRKNIDEVVKWGKF